MIMKSWLYTEHIFVDVLNQNYRKCDNHFLSYDLLSKSFRKVGHNSKERLSHFLFQGVIIYQGGHIFEKLNSLSFP